MEPTHALQAAQEWITVLATIGTLLAAALLAAARLYATTRKKLHAVLRGVEESELAHLTAKRSVERAAKADGVELDHDIERATGRMTRRMRKLAPLLLVAIMLSSCAARPDFAPAFRELGATVRSVRVRAETAPVTSDGYGRLVVTPELIARLKQAEATAATAERLAKKN